MPRRASGAAVLGSRLSSVPFLTPFKPIPTPSKSKKDSGVDSSFIIFHFIYYVCRGEVCTATPTCAGHENCRELVHFFHLVGPGGHTQCGR